jgi:hypothetical protein
MHQQSKKKSTLLQINDNGFSLRVGRNFRHFRQLPIGNRSMWPLMLLARTNVSTPGTEARFAA